MRIAFVVHGFPPHEHTGVETHVAHLARNLARRGLSIEVFAPRADSSSPEFAQRREARDGYSITWLIANRVPESAAEHLDPPGMAAAFGEFLDRTRPGLVHFHHLQKIGIAALEQSSKRGIPSIYTAHDYYPVCHRTILARPDLSRCTTLGDSRACARCDLAVSYLNGRERWSDYHAGVLPASLPQAERLALARCLEAGSEAGAAFEQRARLDRRRKQAFAALEGVLAPTEFLRRQLIAGGFEPQRVELCDYGIEFAELAALAPPREGSKATLGFGYIGGALKHKGLHVLLEACAGLGPRARLEIHADSSDREYLHEMRARARAVGAHWHGAFPAGDLPRVMAGIDALVVPSIWWENAPFAIREAFAAHRPVIASDLPALRESVRDSVDGLLVPPDDPDALRSAMERLASQPELFAKLASNTRAPRSLDELADELIARYRALIDRRRREVPARVPGSARAFAERVLALESLSVAELAQRASDGLAGLARSLGVDVRHAELPDAREIALERLHDARREIAWRVERDAEWDEQAGQLANSNRALASELAHALRDGELARSALARAQEELAARGLELEASSRAQSAARAALEREQRAHEQARAALAAASDSLNGVLLEHAKLDTLRRALELALSQMQDSAQAAQRRSEAFARAHAELERHLKLCEQHARWLEVEAANFAQRFGHAATALRDERDVRAAHAVFDRLERELEWRRREMFLLREEGGRIIRALVDRSGLGRRMRGWEREP